MAQKTRSPRRGGWRGLWWRLPLALVLGAVMTVAVAWGFVLWGVYGAPVTYDKSDYEQMLRRPELWLADYPLLSAGKFRAEYPYPLNHPEVNMRREAVHSGGLGYHEVALRTRVFDANGQLKYVGRRAGWPLPCLRADTNYAAMSKSDILEAFIDPPTISGLRQHGVRPSVLPDLIQRIGVRSESSLFDSSRNFRNRTIPIRPLPLGFALNTLLYGALMFSLMLALGVLRRWRRKRKGLCAWCRYDRAGLATATACPECGVAAA